MSEEDTDGSDGLTLEKGDRCAACAWSIAADWCLESRDLAGRPSATVKGRSCFSNLPNITVPYDHSNPRHKERTRQLTYRTTGLDDTATRNVLTFMTS